MRTSNGSVWSPQLAGANFLTKVWEAASNDVWAIYSGGGILHESQ